MKIATVLSTRQTLGPPGRWPLGTPNRLTLSAGDGKPGTQATLRTRVVILIHPKLAHSWNICHSDRNDTSLLVDMTAVPGVRLFSILQSLVNYGDLPNVLKSHHA